jgi:hypothetical protein
MSDPKQIMRCAETYPRLTQHPAMETLNLIFELMDQEMVALQATLHGHKERPL